jgi:uncharacterized protein YecE (DUF72 family)
VIRVGIAGWSYPDWEGIVYPSPHPSGFDPLAFLARFVDVVEINSSFYRPPAPRTAAKWAARVANRPRFTFTAKLWRGFTHERNATHETEERQFREGLAPLAEAGRLSCVLVQFPHSFKPSGEGKDYLARILDRFSDFPLVVELRRQDWVDEGVLAWLRDRGIGFCNVDQPRLGLGGGATLGPTRLLTARRAYVRLHGRNRETWFAMTGTGAEAPPPGEPPRGAAGTAARDARYDYLYTPAELRPWVETLRELDSRAEVTHLIANNHFRGKAVVNALMIKAMIEAEPVEGPSELAAAYPQLAPFLRPAPRGTRQERLF